MAPCWSCQNPLPETPVERCPACGAIVAAGASAPLLPPPAPAAQRPDRTPWDDRDRLGFLTALVETTRLVLTRPGEFFRSMPVEGGIGAPLLYAVVVGWAGVVVASLYQAIFRSVVGSSLGALGEHPELAQLIAFTESWAGFVAQVVFGGVFVAIGVFVWSAIVHVALLIVGGARSGFEGTLRVVCFSQATSVLLLVPFCGQLVAPIWALVIDIIGLAETHRIGHGRSTAAVLLPVALLCCCCAGAIALFAGALASVVSQVAR
jgi:hypothetical protein